MARQLGLGWERVRRERRGTAIEEAAIKLSK